MLCSLLTYTNTLTRFLVGEGWSPLMVTTLRQIPVRRRRVVAGGLAIIASAAFSIAEEPC